ncbi:MAG: 4Fe-4S dicluster domain-containing protein [Desulfotomaculaceae bacterium]
MVQVNPGFIDQVGQAKTFNAAACMNCGICSAVCPMGIELLPRKLFRYVLLGVEDKVRENSATIYSCLLCKMCEVNCPAGVHIAENVRTLRYYLYK